MDIDSHVHGQNAVLQGSSALKDMPEELLEIIRARKSPQFLDTLSLASLKPALTLRLFIIFESVFADSCSRWISKQGDQDPEIIEAFARILPLAPHLSTYLRKYLRATCSDSDAPRIHSLEKSTLPTKDTPVQNLQRALLAIFRLLNFDKGIYGTTISATKLQPLFHNEDRAVRYLAIRIFCLLRSASDFKLEQMIEEHVGNEQSILGDFDGDALDYGFLSLFEKKRLNGLQDLRDATRHMSDHCFKRAEAFCPLVRLYAKTLLPRPNGPPLRPSGLVPTETTMKNMETFAKALLSSSPILLHGLAGSGKTSLVNDFARELSVDSNIVTLHLNEQTDAKMLIGMYATGSTPGSFTWRAGVLTTAVREGRWVFIEDFDRAPNEVISVILPLIERGELLIPSRGETIKAGPGFRLLASIRTSLNVSGHENPPTLHMLGARLWKRVPVQMPSQDEFREVIHATHPILRQFIRGIINVYERVYALSQKPSFASKSRTSLGRPVSPRDLLKWCRRLDNILVAAGSKTGKESISEATAYEMFLEAIDCFASSLQTDEARRSVISCIAEEMHIDPQRVDHFLTSHTPRYEENERELTVGRVRLAKQGAGRVAKHGKKSRPFANTTHAKRLLEQVGVAVRMAEPVLLVGETGIGKTTVIQQLADSLGYKLTAVNLSQQSEVGDLLGGFKPVNIRSLAVPLKDEFEELFAATGISTTKNQKYVDQLGKCIAKSQWSRALKLWREAPKMFERILFELAKKESADDRTTVEQAPKRRKTESKLQSLSKLKPRWEKFSQDLDQFDVQLSGGSKGFAFTFVEGNIVKAARNGEWVLLDEINLASPDTLESIADLLHSGSGNTPSILLSETGEIERVRAHPNFRIFGAMNPATDVGKRDLPMGLRSRFTEIFVESPDGNLDDLLCVIKAYLVGTSSTDDRAAHDVAKLYMNTKRLAAERRLVDGANQVPHFSLRTLTRVLSYVTSIAPSYGLRRALYEGFAMGFLTLLDRDSENMLIPLINHHLLESHGNPQALLAQTPRHPEDGKQYVRFMNKKRDRQYWMLQGMETPEEQPHYIITPFVERNMLNLVRATSTRRFPVLIQGPTSSGKTSMIEYLAKFSGNKFVRINNHEHTDLQEYLGAYVSGSDGQLRFQEGLLVQALRQGHWIVLDELNLAPTDVLEALNRLLDDNRELLIPETQEIVRPHDNFMLFATQNPAGLYGGRKTLSRAFRNRFLELHFDDIPEDELDFILEKRSQKVAPSDCRRIVSVYKELSLLRQSNRLFEQKDSFATLRDLFRWALRDADNREQLAANGFMLLAERVRNPEERQAVKEIIERVMKVKLDTNVLYDASLSPEIKAYNTTANTQGVVWTHAMRRLYVLVAHALRNNEPVLLVGETGCGKTTVCQMLADAFGKELHMVNAHQNTETGDLIGAQRPVRNRAAILEQLRQDLATLLSSIRQEVPDQDLDSLISTYRMLSEADFAQVPGQLKQRVEANLIKSKALFEWSDGSLVQAMKEAQFFLLDEISLADDSVLERLNSVLESHRTILLAEKGVEDSFVQAAEGFQFLATMNPGGDYGKRELSPALRNRFTEIWVPSLSEHEDVFQIVESKLSSKLKQFSGPMVHFAEWFGQTYRSSASTSISVRDVLAWVKFMNGSLSTDPYFSVLHGAAMVYIDTLGANPAALLAINPETIREERAKCLQKLGDFLEHNVSSIYFSPVHLASDDENITIGPFPIAKQPGSHADPGFAFGAPTTKMNAMRVSRALQVQKPILIEGSPGVGKTTLIAALARACGKPLTRINLSEQTDLMDLFGSDVPVEGAEAGHFAWRDAPFLQAMQRGEWVLLDEMNLASQSVLEGLNACLDHRGEVYISELDQTFKRHPNFSVFAAQNPHHQGGGRKGLPSSFVNRFTVVYADVFRNEDLELICQHNFPDTPVDDLKTIIAFVSELEQDIVHKRRFGSQGGPWEFNLRDILRWLQLLASKEPFLGARSPADYLNLIFRLRFRSSKDRQEVDKIFAQVFGSNVPFRQFFHNLSSKAYQVGVAYTPRDELTQRLTFPPIDPINRLPEIEAVMICVQQNMPCILVGPSGSGKTSIIEHVAAACGKSLVVFPLNADIDTMDLVGGFEQVDPQRAASAFIKKLKEFLGNRLLLSLPNEVPEEAIILLEQLDHGDQSPAFFTSLALNLDVLASKTSLPEFGDLASSCKALAETPMTLENARFEWVDGVLVKALERGEWLVLDNANLCSASVLDRLNSLLEPNGFLSINEHCGPDGEPKIVKPHPDSRIFLTMDARFGEVSRAMRNRATEIFLEPFQLNSSSDSIIPVKPEPAMERYNRALRALEASTSDPDESQLICQVALDNLAWSDMPLLPRFAEAFQLQAQSSSTVERYLQIYQTGDNLTYRAAVGDIWEKYAAKTGLPKSFRDAQILHPLQNSPLVPLVQQSSSQIYWLAGVFELKLSAIAAVEFMSQQADILKTLKPSRMNRLQRSLISARVPAVASDSTVRASNFLSNTIGALRMFLSDHVEVDDWKLAKRAVTNSLQFWWETYRLVTSKDFDEATFQAHLAIGTNVLSSFSGNDIVEIFQRLLQSELNPGFKLKTGLSMEILWKELRPLAVPNLQTIRTLLEMEKLATRFDALRWNVSISVSELGAIMSSLVKAYRLVLTSNVDGESLIKTLGDELTKLEASIGHEEDRITPFFTSQFEGLRQFQTLEAMRFGEHRLGLIDLDTIILANHRTDSEMRLSSSSDTSRSLQIIDYLWGPGNGLQPITGTFSADVLHKLNGLGEVDLRSLRLLESELPIMGEKLASSTELLCRQQLPSLNKCIFELMVRVFDIHGGHDPTEYVKQIRSKMAATAKSQTIKFDDLGKIIEQYGHNPVSNFKEDGESQISTIANTHFHPAMVCMAASDIQPQDSIKFSALAWIYFAIGCLKLYVPDRAFDPDKRQKLERQKHIQLKGTLQSKLAALRQFENLMTGQETNLRCQLVEEELAQLREPAEVLQEIYRPEISELDQLQGEFKNLLTTVVQSDLDDKILGYFRDNNTDGLQDIKLMQNNVHQIIRRLVERFQGYTDLTSPAINMLRCFQIGLSMVAIAVSSPRFTTPPQTSPDTPLESNPILTLARMSPFLGATNLNYLSYDKSVIASHPMEYLSAVSLVTTVEGFSSLRSDHRRCLIEAVHRSYELWAKRLQSDRLEAESKTGLYRFKGSADDEDEEDQEQFNELFPSYEEDSPEAPRSTSSAQIARDTAVQLAKLHSSIFDNDGVPFANLLSLIRQISSKIGATHEGTMQYGELNLTGALLPGALLLLNDQIEALSPNTTVSEAYNFYTDAHLPETRKLVSLIHQVQERFRELQAVDEIGHMQPLEDVIVSCRELLQFRHTEPLAKIITKVEKVHGFMHEWQFGGWASRTNSVLALYDGITTTIVSWRRLELSTWAKLFEMESRYCDDDARSWWFVAYQVVIAAPLSIAESNPADGLRTYAQKLLKDLEMYFSTAIVGQFKQRLQLLKQLQNHLEILILEFPQMAVISDALTNFISIYERYKKPVEEHLKKGRVSLEKSMRDVILLATWKDTNIVALRDSAKRSHHNLFKIVRKFRALLGQPMEIILNQGLPDETAQEAVVATHDALLQYPTVDLSALTICAQRVPKWSDKSKRFVNVSKTVSMMADAGRIPDSALDGMSYLNSFIANIISSTAELQKATPSVLTEDNKVTVKHLKSRKRKLFADTLKDLRNMGIKHNLGANALSKQDSLSTVLTSTKPLPPLKDFDTRALMYYFEKSLDIAPRAREATRQHSEDLTGAEIARSSGFLEGLLQLLLAQQNTLATATVQITKLEEAVAISEALWAPKVYNIRNAKNISNHKGPLRWILNILSVGAELLRIQSNLGKIDNKTVEERISSFITTFQELSTQWDTIPELPANIISTVREDLSKLVKDSFIKLSGEIQSLSEQRPDLSFILDQILLWTRPEEKSITESTPMTISELDQKMSTVCDSILLAIEKHQKSNTELPTSTEDPGWLVKNEAVIANCINSLHSDYVTQQLQQAFEVLRGLNLEDDKISRTAAAIFAVAQPVLEQYKNILHQTVTRYAELHQGSCKTFYILAKTYTQIASQGFCTPSEKSEAQDGKTEKLEGGTGLGDGEGAEDISKDIQDDEDLDELAQEPNAGEKGDMEDEKDAVDMADGDMEGEMGEGEEKDDNEEGSGDDESGDDMDEEAGDVDDLDPTAVDEKMWDGDNEEAEKDQEGDESKGKQQKDEQAAAQDNGKQAEEGDGDEQEPEEMEGAEQGEDIKQQDDVEKHDPHAQESEVLDLPEDMELDGDGDEENPEGSDDGMKDLSDVEEDAKGEEEVKNDGKDVSDEEDLDQQDPGSDMDVIDLDEENEDTENKTEEAGEAEKQAENDSEEQQPEDHDNMLRDKNDEATADAENAVLSEVQGVGEDQDENSAEDNKESASKAQREDGGEGGESSEQKDAAAEDGEKGRQANADAPQDTRDETRDSTDAQPFKKLGDALESWHRQQTQIREAPESKEKSQDQDVDMNAEGSEFQHLQDEEAEADTQALGTASEEQAHALDESMAVDSESKDLPEQFQPDEADQEDASQDDLMDLEDSEAPQEQPPSDAYEGRAGAMISQANEHREEDLDESRAHAREDLEEDVEEVDNQLEATHLETSHNLSLRSAADAREQWTHYEAVTRDLSLSLTEQLRLILAPTLATKMRGDFRTGKRLNIKRIIPYIASQYKRDKIWMRRSVPSKRSYQVMLAVDDSKSMGESGSGSLAFETLVMVSKALSMLEVGEICVVGFGDSVKVAHDFDTPFSSDAGPRIFQNFGFEQSRTDVTKLVRESIQLFRSARQKASGSPADLWQMQLIISDGVCDSSEHEPIRRLLREALEERIMMVFVIVDDVRNKKQGESVMDLKEAKFVKNEMTGVSNVKIERYLDTFPFQYYLIVSDVKELPGVLATLLRQWFAEVVDSSS